eukprot:gene969-biopygen823
MAGFAPGKGSTVSEVEQLLNYCRQGDLTQVARILSSTHVCETLVQRFGADLNQGNHRGNTPLHYCFNFGHENIGQLLIDC